MRHFSLTLCGLTLALTIAVAARADTYLNPDYATGTTNYSPGPIYDYSRATAYPLAKDVLAALGELHHVQYVIEFSNNMSPLRRSLVLGEIDVALYELEHSNLIDLSAPGAARPTYESSLISGGGAAPEYPGEPTYDNSRPPPNTSIAYDSVSAISSLARIRDTMNFSSSLSQGSRDRVYEALSAAINDMQGIGRP